MTAGVLMGGRAGRIAQVRARFWWLAPIALCVQTVLINGFRDIGNDLFAATIMATYVALVIIVIANRALPGARVMALGILLNLLVIVANGGLMPVSPEIIQRAGRFEPWKVGNGLPGTRLTQSKDVLRLPEDTWFEFLADRYWTGLPGRLGSIFSIGDVVLLVGLCFFVVRVMTTVPDGSAISGELKREDHRFESNNGIDNSTHTEHSTELDSRKYSGVSPLRHVDHAVSPRDNRG